MTKTRPQWRFFKVSNEEGIGKRANRHSALDAESQKKGDCGLGPAGQCRDKPVCLSCVLRRMRLRVRSRND